MPVHDWKRVSDGAFHDFHYSWVLEIKRALKRGPLPESYYVIGRANRRRPRCARCSDSPVRGGSEAR